MKAKLIDGNLEYAPKIITLGNTNYIPPTDNWLSDNGYKEIIEVSPPEREEGYYFISYWEETETVIVRAWECLPIPVETEVNK